MDINVINLGGSLITSEPGKYNFEYISKFRDIIKKDVKKRGSKYIIIVGGGKNARHYQGELKSYYEGLEIDKSPSNESLDRIGIQSTRMNAQFLKETFGSFAHPIIYSNFDKPIPNFDSVLFGGGWKPGRSTDFCSMQHIVNLELTSLINLSNIGYVYDKDPNKFSDAKPYKTIKWSDYRDQVGDDWKPGANAPFDPVASLLGHKKDKFVKIIFSDEELKNLEAAIFSDDFDGTLIGDNKTVFLDCYE